MGHLQCAHSPKGHLHMGRKRARATSTALDGYAWGPGCCNVRGVYGNRLWRSLDDHRCIDCVEIMCQSQEAAEAGVLATVRFQGQLKFPLRRAVGRFVVAMESTGETETRLVILDAMHANVIKSVQMPIQLCGVLCREAVVDPSGTKCVLIQCNGSVWAWQETETMSMNEDQWTELVNPKIRAKNDLERSCCKSGVFMSTPILSSCFSLIHATLDTRQTISFDHIIYDTDSGWTPLSVSSRIFSLDTNMAMDVDDISQLCVSRNGNWCVIFKNFLAFCLSTDRIDENEENSLHSYHINAEVANATWKPRRSDDNNDDDIDDIDDMDTLTVLLSNGQLLDIALGITCSLEPVEVEEMMKISQVVWLGKGESHPKLLAFEDSSPVLLTIESVDEMRITVSSISFDSRWYIRPIDSESFNMLWRRHRFWLHSDRQSLEQALHPYCESSSSKNMHGLLNMLRIFLGQSSEDSVHDIVFTLTSIIHQQGMSVVENGVSSSAAAIFLDLLVTRTVSITCWDRAQFVTYLMAAPSAFPSRNARRYYYRHQLKCLCLRILQDEDKQQDYISAKNAFLSVYSPIIISLAYKISVMEANKFALVINQCKRTCELLVKYDVESLLEDTHRFKRDIALNCNYDDVYSEILMIVIVSYSMACTSLCIDGFLINMPRLLMLLRSNEEFTPEKTFRKEMLIPLLRVLNTDIIVDSKITEAATPNDEWSIQQALQMAIVTQTAPLLFSFCVESGSSSSNECIQKMTKDRYKVFSKNFLFNQGYAVDELEMSVCETYLSEIIAILQHLPLVRDIQHAAPHDSIINGEAFVKSAWENFLKDVYTRLQVEESHKPVKATPELVFSNQEMNWQYRMMHLKNSLMWHLENQVNRARNGDHDEMPKLLARIFLLEFLQDAHKNSDDTKLIHKFLIKSQDALACSSSMTSLIERRSVSHEDDIGYQRTNDHQQICFRFEKLLRSIAVVTWSLWVRDRCTYCCRLIEQIKRADVALFSEDATNTLVGSMAATCALQLNVIGLVVGKVDQISFLQTSLLEDAAKLCPRKTAAVLGWGFPTDKINARYLKRYKAVRHLLKSDMEANKSNDDEDLEEIENRCQFIQSHVKRKIRDFIANGRYQQGSGMTINSVISSPKGSELKRRWAMEIDVFVDCCCTLDFQHLVWALIRKKLRCNEKSEAFIVSTKTTTITNQKQPIETAGQGRSMSSLRTKDTSMSHEEILALLRTQQEEFDIKVQSLFSSQQKSNHETKEQPKPSPPSEHENKSLAYNSQLVSKFRDFTRDLSSRHQSFPDLDAERRKEINSNETMLQRGQSVQNVLKLLQLRKNTEETTTDPRHVVGHLFANTAVQKMATEDADSHKTEIMDKKANIALLQRKQPVRPSVFSLKFEEDVNGAHLKLLRCGNGKPPAVKLRAKQFNVPERAQSSIRKREHNVSESINHEVAALRTASVQTDTIPEPLNSVKSVTWADIDTNSREKSMEEQHASESNYNKDEQNEQISETAKTVNKNPGSSSIATQCVMNSPFLHKSTQVKPKAKLTAVSNVPCAYHRLSTHIQLIDERRKKFRQVVQSSTSCPSRSSKFEAVNEVDDGNIILIDPEQQQIASSKATEVDKHPSKEVHSVSDEATSKARMLKYQAKYREQVSLRNVPALEKKNGNAHAFAGLHDDMQRIKQRLHDLEHFADTIDEDFKDSHYKLLHMGDSQDGQAQAQMLEAIDSVLRETSEFDSRVVDASSKPPASSVLERQAASDMMDAKNLLAKIERLALAVDSDGTG